MCNQRVNMRVVVSSDAPIQRKNTMSLNGFFLFVQPNDPTTENSKEDVYLSYKVIGKEKSQDVRRV